MAVLTDSHTRVVFWLKILLPLLALAILATLFLFARQTPTDGSLPFSDVDVAELAREQRLTGAEYSGVTADGARIVVTAATARPIDGGSAVAEYLGAHLDLPSGVTVDISAQNGQLSPNDDALIMKGDVVVTTSTGYRVTSQEMRTALRRTEVLSEEPVTVDAPYGRIDAGAMALTSDAETGEYDMVFKGGVRLVYQPAN